jgi:hypothetical protein
VDSSGLARWLVICTPGEFAGFVLAASQPATSTELPPPPPTAPTEEEMAALGALALEHGIELLGPPGMLPSGWGRFNSSEKGAAGRSCLPGGGGCLIYGAASPGRPPPFDQFSGASDTALMPPSAGMLLPHGDDPIELVSCRCSGP